MASSRFARASGVAAAALVVMLLVGGSARAAPAAATPTPRPTSTTIPNPNRTLALSSVSIVDFVFSPSALTVSAGSTVSWSNSDSATHTVTSGTGVWDSGFLQTGQTFQRTFATAGTYAYLCALHTQMTGSITVPAAATPIPSTPSASPTPSTPGVSIGASPNPIPAGPGSGTTTISWNTGTSTPGEVRLSVNGAAEIMFGGGVSGTGTVSWLNSGNSYRFTLYAGNTHTQALAQVTAARSVTSGSISASPNPAPTGSTTISFDTNGNGDTGVVYVSINGGAEFPVWQNPRGVEIAPWITQGSSYGFTLYAGQGHLSSAILGAVTVTNP